MAANRDMFKRGITPCEWNPDTSQLANLSDEYHAAATVAIGQTSRFRAEDDRRMRVCERCSHLPSATDAAATKGLRIVRRPLRKPSGADLSELIDQGMATPYDHSSS
jgi:hypothetical protein